MSWTRYQIHAVPRHLTAHEKSTARPGRTHVLVIDPHLRIELPPEGRVCEVDSYATRVFWDRREAEGSVEISDPALVAAPETKLVTRARRREDKDQR